MSIQTDQQRTDRARIERLRERLAAVEVKTDNERKFNGVLKGLLDLVSDMTERDP